MTIYSEEDRILGSISHPKGRIKVTISDEALNSWRALKETLAVECGRDAVDTLTDKTILSEEMWEEVLAKLPKKKNGTLAKSRVMTLYRAEPLAHEDIDAYGYRMPVVFVRSVDDFEAHFIVEDKIIKYDEMGSDYGVI